MLIFWILYLTVCQTKQCRIKCSHFWAVKCWNWSASEGRMFVLWEKNQPVCVAAASWLPVGMQLLRQLFNCLTNLKGHCQMANIFHNIWLLLRTLTVHFIYLQQCAKHGRFITQQAHNLDKTGCSFPFLIFRKRINGLPEEVSTQNISTAKLFVEIIPE